MTGPVIVPAVTETPAGCALLATKLEEAIHMLKSWELRVSAHSRLRRAVALLGKIASLDAYPTDAAQLIRIGNAIRLAFDFYHITTCLPPNRVDALAEDLRRALKGTLDDDGPTEAHRAQSQVFTAAVMAVGGLRPRVAALGEKTTPDYVIHVGSLPFGIEIKRPASAAQILARVDRAVEQLEAYRSRYGVIVLDVSDCLPRFVSAQSPDEALGRGQGKFRTLHRDISDYITKRGGEPGFSRVAVLFVFANLFIWRRTQTPIPMGAFSSYAEVFPKACSGLIVNESRTVRKQLMRGLEVFGAHIQHLERVSE